MIAAGVLTDHSMEAQMKLALHLKLQNNRRHISLSVWLEEQELDLLIKFG